jgi:hypothetical protein
MFVSSDSMPQVLIVKALHASNLDEMSETWLFQNHSSVGDRIHGMGLKWGPILRISSTPLLRSRHSTL